MHSHCTTGLGEIFRSDMWRRREQIFHRLRHFFGFWGAKWCKLRCSRFRPFGDEEGRIGFCPCWGPNGQMVLTRVVFYFVQKTMVLYTVLRSRKSHFGSSNKYYCFPLIWGSFSICIRWTKEWDIRVLNCRWNRRRVCALKVLCHQRLQRAVMETLIEEALRL